VITGVRTGDSGRTGVYYDEKGRPMNGSTLVREPEFTSAAVSGAYVYRRWSGKRCARYLRSQVASVGDAGGSMSGKASHSGHDRSRPMQRGWVKGQAAASHWGTSASKAR
jgi:hypothetical protein